MIRKPETEIITPLAVKRRSQHNDPPTRKVPSIRLWMVFGFACIAAGLVAGWLLWHLKHHAEVADLGTSPPKMIQPSTDTPAAPVAKGTEASKSPAPKLSEAPKTAATEPAPKLPEAPKPATPEPAPKLSEASKASPVEPAPKLPETDTPVAPTRQEAGKAEAEQQLGLFLEAKTALEQKGVSEWGGDLYSQMMQDSQAADALLLDHAYADAVAAYATAKSKADLLLGQAAETLQGLLAEGQAALNSDDSRTAVEKFTVALKIDSSDPTAKAGLERARNLPEVTRLIESGQQHEAGRQFAFALADYEAALKLDPQSGAAATGLERVRTRIKNDQFRQLMSKGLAALNSGNFAAARSRLLKARGFKPNSKAVADALAQVDQAEKLAQIESLRRKAVAAEENENWEGALEIYLAVLKLDPNVSFAVGGKSRAMKQIRIAKRIDFFLSRPDLLASDQHLQQALALIDEAGEITPQGDQLAGRIQRLRERVAAAQATIPVTIESDNRTEVAVYKVGKLGSFTARELNLRPGTYTAVGSRDGYQDVRRKIVIRPGQKPVRITIVCQNKI